MSFYFFNSLKNSKFEGQNVDIYEISHKEKPSLNREKIRDLNGVVHTVQSFKNNQNDVSALDKIALSSYYEKYKTSSLICDNVNFRIGFGSNYLVTSFISTTNFNQIIFQIISENRKYLSYQDMRDSLIPNGSLTNGLIGTLSGTGGVNACVILVSTNYLNEEYIGFCDLTNYPNFSYYVYRKSDLEKLGGTIDINIHDDIYGDISTSGGYGGGSFDNTSDAIGVPQNPAIGATTTGFINVYNPSLNELQGFADDLFPDFEIREFSDKSGIDGVVENVKVLGETMHDILESFINSNLINYVIDCHIVPAIPQVGDKVPIKVGFKNFNQSSAKVTSDYVTVDCGTLNIAEYYQNFIDYIGTSAQLYLPFVGFVSIEPEYFQNGSLHIVYSYNVIDGSFMAFILSTSSKSNLKETVIGSYGGNCCVHIPITGLNYSSMISGVVQGVGSMTSNIASANPIGVASSAMSIASAKPDLENSNAYNANSAFMGVRIPYLLIKRQVSSFSANYTKENALPLNVSKKLDSVKGLTFCDNIILDGINATEEEKEKIKELFKGGVIM